MRAHLVEGGLVRAPDLLAEGAGLGARIDLRRAGGDGAVGGGAHVVEGRLAYTRRRVGIAQRLGAVCAGAHVVERGLARAGGGRDGGLRVGRLHGLILALDA
jgi:hypothetical protein